MRQMNRMKIANFLFCFILLLNFAYAQKTYYVSPSGSDTNSGSMDKPFQSIAKLNQVLFQPGDQILFKANATFMGTLVLDQTDSSSAEHPITIGSYGKGRAILKARSGNGILIQNLNGIHVQNLIVTSHSLMQNDGYGVKIYNDASGNKMLSNVSIKNVEASNFKWSGIYVGGVPTDLPTVKPLTGSRFGFKDVEILNCVAHHNMYYGIYITASWTTTSTDYGNQDVIIRDCIAHHNMGDATYTANHSGSGIMVDDTRNVLIEYCTAYHNGEANAGKSGGPCGIWTHASTRVIIQYCEAFNNKTGGAADGGGFDLDGGVTNAIIQYCYSHDNDGPGYLMWNYEGAPHSLSNNTLRYNISANDGRKHTYGAIHIGTSGLPITNIKVYNNTLYMPHTLTGGVKGIWIGGSAANDSLYFFNNAVITDKQVPLLEVEQGQTNIVFAGNAYWCNGDSFLLQYEKIFYSSLADWQISTRQENWQGRRTGIFQNPKIIFPNRQHTIYTSRRLNSLKSFQLQVSSPLIKSGIELTMWKLEGVLKDFWGTTVPKNAKPDIGTHQFTRFE
jgi:hypothetical protein